MAAFPRIKSKLCSRSTRDIISRAIKIEVERVHLLSLFFPLNCLLSTVEQRHLMKIPLFTNIFPSPSGFALILLLSGWIASQPTQSHWDSIYEHRKVLEIDDADVTTSISVSHVDNSVRNKSRGPFGVTSLIAWGTSSYCRPISIRKVVKEAWRDGSTAPHHRTKCCFNYTSTLFHPDASFRRKV